jgi:hypothetical protein
MRQGSLDELPADAAALPSGLDIDAVQPTVIGLGVDFGDPDVAELHLPDELPLCLRHENGVGAQRPAEVAL